MAVTGQHTWNVRRPPAVWADRWCDQCMASTRYALEVLRVTPVGLTSVRVQLRCPCCDDHQGQT